MTRLISKNGDCPKCNNKQFKVKVCCHFGSMYDDILQCVKCSYEYDCYQADHLLKNRLK